MNRTPKTGLQTQRRQFIGELAAGAAALAAAACAPASTATNAPSQAPKPATQAPQSEIPGGSMPDPPKTWDATWMNRITAKHKAIFDSPEISEGTALYHAMSYLGSVKDVFGTGDSDASVVVVLRHRAVPLLFNDAMWAKYDLGTATKTNDSKTGKPATRAAAAAKLTPQQVYEDIRANLVPGATLMPTGVFATLMAQEAGCSLMRST